MKITIVTPTIRNGWWNIMAENLSHQTYKDFTWLVIDDAKEDRSKIAAKYAKKYKLDIQYAKAKKASPQRKYGLVNANNSVCDLNDADLFIWLQDFILIDKDAVENIERLANIYPSTLIACVDDAFDSAIPFDLENKEDYFNGCLDIQGERMMSEFTKKPYSCWRNRGRGERMCDDPYEFEMNFCAIPRSIIKSLNGWWEFMDDGFGFDNTEFAYRALKRFKMIVAQDIIGIGINHSPLEKTGDVKERYFNYNDARYNFLASLTEVGHLPVIRDEKIDSEMKTPYNIPIFLDREYAEHFMRFTTKFYVPYWIHVNFPEFYKTLGQNDLS